MEYDSLTEGLFFLMILMFYGKMLSHKEYSKHTPVD